MATDVSTTREDGFRTGCLQQLSFSEPQSAKRSFSIKVSNNKLRWIELAYNCSVVDSGERSRGPGPSSYFWTKVKPVLNSLSPKNTKNYESAGSFFFFRLRTGLPLTSQSGSTTAAPDKTKKNSCSYQLQLSSVQSLPLSQPPSASVVQSIAWSFLPPYILNDSQIRQAIQKGSIINNYYRN